MPVSLEQLPTEEYAAWREGVITGCVYPATGEVFVRYSNAFRAAGVLLGKVTPPAASHVCRAPVTSS